MSATKITLAANPISGNLQLVYLDSTGAPFSFVQDLQGVWHGLSPSGAAPVPNPGGTLFSAIQLVPDGGSLDLIALGQDGLLRLQVLDGQDNWNPAGFQLLSDDNQSTFAAFSVTSSHDLGPMVAAIQTEVDTTLTIVGGQGSWTQLGWSGQPATSGPVAPGEQPGNFPFVFPPQFSNLVVTVCLNHGERNWDEFPVVFGWIAPGDYPGNGQPPGPAALYCADDVNWQWATFPWPDGGVSTFYPQSAAFPHQICSVTGGWINTQQVIILGADGVLYLLFDDSENMGSSWGWYGALPNATGITYSSVACGQGADGNLQVVGIGAGDQFPRLIWQDLATGAWARYQNPDGVSGMRLPLHNPAIGVTDLAVGTGNQGVFQVGYIGADGRIYVNWQDKFGNWGSYGPLP